MPAVQGISIPDSKLCSAITELVRDTESELLFNQSSRVFFFAAIAGQRRGNLGFEVDGANAARDFLNSWDLDPSDIQKVWTGIALHTTPGVPEFMHPVIVLTTAGVEMDVLGMAYETYDDATRERIVAAFPRSQAFKEDILQAFYDGIKDKPETTFGNVKADVLADKIPTSTEAISALSDQETDTMTEQKWLVNILATCSLAMALTACQKEQPSDVIATTPKLAPATNNSTDSVVASSSSGQTSVSKSHATVSTKTGEKSGSSPRDCQFVVDGKVEVSGRCLVFPMGDGGYTLNTWDQGKPRQSHFAVVSAQPDGTAEATWNADPNDDRAGDPLGTVKLENGCWVNDRVRLCAH